MYVRVSIQLTSNNSSYQRTTPSLSIKMEKLFANSGTAHNTYHYPCWYWRILLYHTTRKAPWPPASIRPREENVVALGSVWGTTSLLSTIDTRDYNILCDFFAFSIIYLHILIPQGRY